MTQPHLPGPQQLATADHAGGLAGPLREPLGEVHLVTAPRDVHPPDLSVPETEAGRTGHEQQGGVVPGAASPSLPQPSAVVEGLALRRTLPAPPAGQVEDLAGLGRDRQQDVDRSEVEDAARGARQRVSHP